LKRRYGRHKPDYHRKYYADKVAPVFQGYTVRVPRNEVPRLKEAARLAGQSIQGFMKAAIWNAAEWYEKNKQEEGSR